MTEPLNVGILLFHEVLELDVVMAYSILKAAKAELDNPDALDVYTVAKARNSVETSNGMVITPLWAFMSAPVPDVLIVPGGKGVDVAAKDKALVAYLNQYKDEVKLLVSITTGAVILGELDLLRELRITTWSGALDRLKDYEVGEAVSDEIVVKNERIWSASGGTAGIDLARAIIEHFFSKDLANKAVEHYI